MLPCSKLIIQKRSCFPPPKYRTLPLETILPFSALPCEVALLDVICDRLRQTFIRRPESSASRQKQRDFLPGFNRHASLGRPHPAVSREHGAGRAIPPAGRTARRKTHAVIHA